ncbi:uncharacterized protein phf11 isoform X2 [Pangasianodon hypophthalmus]|uniref:uncharacterized protein phf11 isoform X2 n=1 Tax=Pangasianodon hypophthalmus TaxID=310915 RepID=UPI002307A602|nr:uncharacterized protein phf11 isoform X2 [Pangasianodon hypophthalmus]
MRPEERSSPSSELCCVLCKRADETKITGPLSRKQGIAAHQNCLLYASGIYCKNSPTFDDLFGFDVEDVLNECKRGRKLKCSYCKKNGATAGCEVKSCKRSYHYPCAHKASAKSEEDQNKGIFRLYCEKHDPNASSGGSEKGDAKIFPSTFGCRSSDTSEQNSSCGGSEPNCTPLPCPPEPSCSVASSSTKLQSPSFVLLFPLSDSETSLRRSQKRKREFLESSSDSDETQSIIDPVFAPVESELEDNTPPKQNMPTLDSEYRSINTLSLTAGTIRSQDKELLLVMMMMMMMCVEIWSFMSLALPKDFESQSLLLTEYRQENVPFTVIADSGPSVESVAENSPDPCSPAAPSPADTTVSNLDQSVSAPEQAAALHSNITVPPNPPVPARPSLDSPPSGATGESSSVKVASSGDLPAEVERCASRDIPPLQMTDELPGSHGKRDDHPLDLTAPGVAHVQFGEPVDHVGVSNSSAALFWRRCNEVGCTEAIFTQLTRQLTSLAERVQNQHATQQDYAVSLRILEASGKLPAIFKQMEQDLQDQERQLQRKREALRDAKAALDKINLSDVK